MAEQVLTTLGELLRAAPAMPRTGWLFVASQPRPASSGSLCTVIDLNAEEDPDDPPVAAQNGLECALDMGTVASIVRNALMQAPGHEVADNVLVRALAYYFSNDAFIDLSGDLG